eukprot:1064357-Prymnesium_polylepis.1
MPQATVTPARNRPPARGMRPVLLPCRSLAPCSLARPIARRAARRRPRSSDGVRRRRDCRTQRRAHPRQVPRVQLGL